MDSWWEREGGGKSRPRSKKKTVVRTESGSPNSHNQDGKGCPDGGVEGGYFPVSESCSEGRMVCPLIANGPQQ